MQYSRRAFVGIERGLQMTKAAGTRIMTASTTLTMAKRSIPFPADIEYEYTGTGASTQEVGRCLEYVRAALA
jgi:hypothetical protein